MSVIDIMKPLTSTQRQFLKSLAHRLQPVVTIGSQGLTTAVLNEIEHSLAAHELIKIKAGTDDIDTRNAWLDEICVAAKAKPVQQIGKMFVIYRPAAIPAISLPK